MLRPLYILLLFPFQLWANGIAVSNLQLDETNRLSVDVSWENSWMYPPETPPENHDAAWIFCKALERSTGQWKHILLEGPLEVSFENMDFLLSSDRVGGILRRSEAGEGSTGEIHLELGLDIIDQSEFSAFRLFATEMVYVPESAFYVGDSISNNALIKYSNNSPYHIDNELLIEVGEQENNLWVNQNFPPAGDVPADFPKGFEGYYVMKYEISQQQYADFLNTLDVAQQQSNQLSTSIEAPCFGEGHIDGERNFITKVDDIFGCDANDNGVLNEADDGCEIACNFLTWSNLTAYLDWSGLRPMSELEFEKACRGPQVPLPLELAFGTAETINTIYPINLGAANETVADTIPSGSGICNFGYCQPSGPLRCGFAASQTTDRISAGSSYYGIMEMSGNVWELCVPLDTNGLLFNGEHGDGQLDGQGNSNTSTWLSGGHRGGAWNSGVQDGFRDVAVSDRFYIYLDPNDQARGTSGGRGVISINRFE